MICIVVGGRNGGGGVAVNLLDGLPGRVWSFMGNRVFLVSRWRTTMRFLEVERWGGKGKTGKREGDNGSLRWDATSFDQERSSEKLR